MAHDRLDPSEFLSLAQAVPVGHKEKHDHLCGPSSLVVYNNVDSWTAWCWRCGTGGWVPKPEANMQERLARRAKQKELDDALQRQVSLPVPACFDITSWPAAARLWLYKAGYGPDFIKRLGAYYHEPTGRVVLPVRDADGNTAFWQARNPEFPEGGPKYLSANVARDTVNVAFGNGQVVLCEDILSAFKLGLSGATGYCVMGTEPGKHTVSYLLGKGCTQVATWFDPDGAGDKARAKAAAVLALVGIATTHIRSGKDPKHYSVSEIRGILSEHGSYAAANHAAPQTVLPTQEHAEPEGS